MIRITIPEDVSVVLLERLDSEDNPDVAEAQARIADAAICYTVVDEKGPIAIIGAGKPDQSGFVCAWAVFTNRVKGKGLLLARLARRIMREGYRDYPVRFILTWNRKGFEEGKKWVELLGFRRAPEFDTMSKRQEPWEGYYL